MKFEPKQIMLDLPLNGQGNAHIGPFLKGFRPFAAFGRPVALRKENAVLRKSLSKYETPKNNSNSSLPPSEGGNHQRITNNKKNDGLNWTVLIKLMKYIESTKAALDGLFALTVAFVNCQEKRIIYLSYGLSTAS